MLSSSEIFPANREQGLKRLRAFVPQAGRVYAGKRNADSGPGLREHVSMLSPYIRYRLITEREIVAAVLEQHTPEQAEKFIQEVFWRTYWKGWLQQRPQVWADFLAERDAEQVRVEKNSGLAKALADAEVGRTGIECFDDWANELRETGYLHNHARMWFASIWIFTLKLPWSLGADFFLRHLIDADPASNTLSWRWVAGIQTRGKTYLARPDNIAKYTGGKYQPTGLTTEAPPIRDEPAYPSQAIETLRPIPNLKPVLLVLHADDLQGFDSIPDGADIKGVIIARGSDTTSSWPYGDKAQAFVEQAMADVADQVTEKLGIQAVIADELNANDLIEQLSSCGADMVISPDAPIGPIDHMLMALSKQLSKQEITLYRFRRAWDEKAWPLAKKGFFPFKKQIPNLLQRAGLVG